MGGGEEQRCCKPVLKSGGLVSSGAVGKLEAQDGGLAPGNESVAFTFFLSSYVGTHGGHVCLSPSAADSRVQCLPHLFFHWHLV